VLFTLPAGTALRLGETQGGWVHIYADTRSGWVYSSLLGNGSGTTAQIRPTESQSRPLSGAFRLRNATAVYDRPGGSRIYVLSGNRQLMVNLDKHDLTPEVRKILTSLGKLGVPRLN